MGGLETGLEVLLLVLLAGTLLHAWRLQQALAALRTDRVALAEAVIGFDTGTRQAEAGLVRLREAADHLAGQLGHAAALKDDLAFLSERGEQLADRLDTAIRTARPLAPAAPATPEPVLAEQAPVRSQAERRLLQALRDAR